MPFIAPCGHAYRNTPDTTLILADKRKKMYISFCCAASGKPVEEFVCMNVKTIKKLEAREKRAAFRVADRTIKPTAQAQALRVHSRSMPRSESLHAQVQHKM